MTLLLTAFIVFSWIYTVFWFTIFVSSIVDGSSHQLAPLGFYIFLMTLSVLIAHHLVIP